MSKKIRIGFIGFGAFSNVRYEILSKIDCVMVVGYYDKKHAREKRIQSYDDPSTLISLCDAVIVSVPPKYAPDYVVMALLYNTHVFCEKPAAINSKELQKIEPYLTEGLILAYGFNHRQHDSIIKIRKILDNGTMGKLLWMRGRYGKEVNSKYKNTWRCDKKINGGGIVIDQGIHMIDLMSYLAKGFDGAQAVLSTDYLGCEGVEDNAFITLYSVKEKISASIHSTITQWRYLFSLEIFLTDGSIILNGLRTRSGNYGEEVLSIKPNTKRDDLREEDITYSENRSWKKEMEEFIDCIKGGREYKFSDYTDAKQITSLIDEIYKKAIWL